MAQALKLTRLPWCRVARPQAYLQKRTFLAPTAVLRADLVQDLYLRELKNYKPTAPKPSDAASHVHTFTPPKPPPAHEEIDIAKDLKAYEDQSVEVEGQTAAGEEDVDEFSKYFENFGEEDEEAAHH